MPIGSSSAFNDIITGVLATNPKSILDLGIGFGMNGCGIRNWYDLGYKQGKKWKTELIGVEAFAAYKNPAWQLYDKVNIMEISEFLEINKQKFNMIIMSDVIEHFTKPQGEALLEQLKQHIEAPAAIMITTPAVWFEQGAAYGNEFERHRSKWSCDDFRKHDYGIVRDGRRDAYGHMMIVADHIKSK